MTDVNYTPYYDSVFTTVSNPKEIESTLQDITSSNVSEFIASSKTGKINRINDATTVKNENSTGHVPINTSPLTG